MRYLRSVDISMNPCSLYHFSGCRYITHTACAKSMDLGGEDEEDEAQNEQGVEARCSGHRACVCCVAVCSMYGCMYRRERRIDRMCDRSVQGHPIGDRKEVRLKKQPEEEIIERGKDEVSLVDQMSPTVSYVWYLVLYGGIVVWLFTVFLMCYSTVTYSTNLTHNQSVKTSNSQLQTRLPTIPLGTYSNHS